MKLCIFCKRCSFEEGYNYSDYTYADKDIFCGTNKIGFSASFNSQEDFSSWNKFAESCKKYDPAE